MTDKAVDAMHAGRELDHIIAEDVFGLKVFREQTDGKFYVGMTQWRHDWQELPCYSTYLPDAWQVLEKMRQLGLAHEFGESFEKTTPWQWYLIKTGYFCLDICRAALKCCNRVADKKEDAVEASPVVYLSSQRT